MARPLEFNRPQAVNKALVLFWHKGYQAASLTDLLVAMGIGRSSFYAAFIDKRSLYIECLDLFAARTVKLLRRFRAKVPPVDALQNFFQRSFVAARGTGAARNSRSDWGCLLVNTVLEMAGVDEDLVARASRYLGNVQGIFQAYLQEAGASRAAAEELAALLMLVNEGVRVSSRRRLPKEQVLKPVSTAFALIRRAIA